MAALVLAACLAVAGPHAPPIPGAGRLTGTTSLPIVYYQGVTADPARNLYFDGVFVGLYRTDSRVPRDRPHRRRDPARRARCARATTTSATSPGTAPRAAASCCRSSATSPTGPTAATRACTARSASPTRGTLQWRYYVKLDPAEIPKAMWNEVSPDGTLLWTSSGDDLLAYRTADISLANAAPEHAPIHSVRRLRGAVPPSGITGATFVDGRMFVAGQGGGPFRVWSIDLATGARRLEIERAIVGESEGLVTAALKGGTLSWLVQPFTTEQKPPTYGPDNATLLSFRRPAAAPGRRAGGGRRRRARALDPLLPALAPDRAAPRRLRGRRAVPGGLHRAAERQARRRGAGADDQARAALDRRRGARAGAADAARALAPARGPAAPAADPPRHAARARRRARPPQRERRGCGSEARRARARRHLRRRLPRRGRPRGAGRGAAARPVGVAVGDVHRQPRRRVRCSATSRRGCRSACRCPPTAGRSSAPASAAR